jgi:peptidoglycan/xylan/chitin deacetylase (PgdA/CDA1 family)
MYHGILPRGSANGFSVSRRAYEVQLEMFCSHMQAIGHRLGAPPWTFSDPDYMSGRETKWALTFDDGLDSVLPAVEYLDSVGWRAHFLIVSGSIGRPGFLTADEIRSIRARGHVIGSHSFSHPDHMAKLPYQTLLEEWRRSAAEIADVLGEPVRVAGVPHGSFAPRVASAAADAGIELLFTSEPVRHVGHARDCVVVGRYAIRHSTSPQTAAALAAGDHTACIPQYSAWTAKKAARGLLGKSYPAIRDVLFKS